MLAEHQLKRLWTELIGAGTRANYFAELVDHYSKIQRRITTANLVLSSGAAALLLLKIDSTWLPSLAAGVVAILSVYSLVAQY